MSVLHPMSKRCRDTGRRGESFPRRPVRSRLALQPLDERVLPSITEFSLPTPNRGPAGITRGPDGNLWFAEVDAVGGDRIGRITPAGQVTEFAAGITPGSQPFEITAGP